MTDLASTNTMRTVSTGIIDFLITINLLGMNAYYFYSSLLFYESWGYR
jgi:hypothetical protein